MHRIKEILASSVYFTVKSPLQWNIACILRNILHAVSEILYVLNCVPTLPEEDTFYACEVILSSSHKRSRLWKEPTQMTKNRGGWSETADSVGRNSLLPLHMLTRPTVPRVRTRFKEQVRAFIIVAKHGRPIRAFVHPAATAAAPHTRYIAQTPPIAE